MYFITIMVSSMRVMLSMVREMVLVFWSTTRERSYGRVSGRRVKGWMTTSSRRTTKSTLAKRKTNGKKIIFCWFYLLVFFVFLLLLVLGKIKKKFFTKKNKNKLKTFF